MDLIVLVRVGSNRECGPSQPHLCVMSWYSLLSQNTPYRSSILTAQSTSFLCSALYRDSLISIVHGWLVHVRNSWWLRMRHRFAWGSCYILPITTRCCQSNSLYLSLDYSDSAAILQSPSFRSLIGRFLLVNYFVHYWARWVLPSITPG